MDWKGLFDKKILARGREYYNDDQVSELDISDDEINAVVYGSEEYEVSIGLENGGVGDMYCDCPYAEDGDHCKHMAAVLYAYEAFGNVPEKKAKKEILPEELIKNADDKTIRSFLLKALKNDERLLMSFRTAIMKPSDSVDVQGYKKRIDRAIKRHGGRYGYIDYNEADDFIDEMTAILHNEIVPLSAHHPADAVELTLYLFKETSDVDIDDSNDVLGYFGSEALEELKGILETADSGSKQQIFYSFMEYLDGSVIDYMEDYIESIFFENFDEPDYLKIKLELCDKRLKGVTADERNNYSAKKWIMHRLDIMKQLGCTDEEIYDFCSEYRNLSFVRKYLVDMMIERKDYDHAIELLKASIKIDSEWSGLVHDHHLKLKELYSLLGRDSEYQSELWILATDFYRLEYLRELRSLHPDDWEKMREQLLSEVDQCKFPEICVEEKMYDRLLSFIKKNCTLYNLKRYEVILSENYPEYILDKYSLWLGKAAQNTANRKTYSEWASMLKRMSKWKGGKSIVRTIVSGWREIYKNRPAMMDELKSAGL